jgi:hypothetical protein
LAAAAAFFGAALESALSFAVDEFACGADGCGFATAFGFAGATAFSPLTVPALGWSDFGLSTVELTSAPPAASAGRLGIRRLAMATNASPAKTDVVSRSRRIKAVSRRLESRRSPDYLFH